MSKERITMTTISSTVARNRLYSLIDEVAETSTPVVITGKRANAVMVSESDWNAIQETLYLKSIKGMGESIKKGMKTPVSKCSKKLDW